MSAYERANYTVAHHEATAEYISFQKLKIGVHYPLLKLTKSHHERYAEGIRALLRSPDDNTKLITTYLPRRSASMSVADFDKINEDCSRPNPPGIVITGHINKTTEFVFVPPT